MANELLIGVKIGASLSGAFNAAFSSARGTLATLGQAADDLKARQARLGDVMARAMAHPTRNLGELRRQYELLGQSIDRLRAKQEKLAISVARGEALKSARAELRGQAIETVGTGVALGAPVVKSVQLAAGFQDQMRDIAITGEFNPAEEARLGNAIRESAVKWNQTQAEVARGAAVLVAGGIQDAKELERFAPVMAKTATATRASMDDLGSVAIALKDNLGIAADGFEGAMNMLAYAGKRGQFEIRDMAKWLPSLTPSFKTMGVTGKEAVAEIGAALQIARKGAGSNDEAANNFRNFLQKLFSQDTKKDFEKANIDIEKSLERLRAQGLTPVQAMLEIVSDYMQSKGPDAAKAFTKAMETKDDKEREIAVQRVAEAYKLGELFQDMQAMNFIRPAIANMGEMKDIKQGSMAAADKGLIDADFKKRTETATEQFKAFKIGLMDVGITIGNVLLPPLVDALNAVRPVVRAFGEWAKEHPGLIKGAIGLVGGLLAGKLAVIGLRYGLNLLLSPFNALSTAADAFSAKLEAIKGLALAGKFDPFLRTVSRTRSVVSGFASRAMSVGLSGIGNGLLGGFQAALPWLGRAGMMLLRLTPIGLALSAVGLLIYKYWQPIKGFMTGLWQGMSSVAGPTIKALIQSVVSFGSAIGRLMLVIPGVGFVFRLLRAATAPVFNAILAGIRAVWSWLKNLLKPVDDVGGKAQNMGKRFGIAFGSIIQLVVNLPVKFLKLGSDLVDGLVNGIKTRLGAAVKAVSDLGEAVAGKFKAALGIHSPSRVFMGFGDNIAQGAAIGIGRSSGVASQAAAGMASQTAAAATATIVGVGSSIRSRFASAFDVNSPSRMLRDGNNIAFGVDHPAPTPAGAASQAATAAAQRLNAGRTGSGTAGAATGAAGGLTIHFSPTIHVQGGTADTVKGQITESLNLSLRDLEQMIKRVTAQQARRAY